MTDDFDLEKLRLPPGNWLVVPAKTKERRKHFVKVPWTWVEKLTAARHIATHRVALYVLYRHWKAGGSPFTLSNMAVADVGVNRWRKWDALGELERLGLITIERRQRKTPRITINI
jgi:hypothetical protein